MKEKEFQSQVIILARLHGWLVMHTRAVELRPGVWKTPLTGHPGFPDLVLCDPRGKGLIFAELKADMGRLSDSQEIWLQAINENGAEHHVWRPKDFQAISSRLARKGKPK